MLGLFSIAKVASKSPRSMARLLEASVHTVEAAACPVSLFQKKGFSRLTGRVILRGLGFPITGGGGGGGGPAPGGGGGGGGGGGIPGILEAGRSGENGG